MHGAMVVLVKGTPLWVWIVLGLWMLLLPAFLLVSLGPPAWR